ncbi:flippase [Granulicella pectinivorans]|uniref:flippase n=1 Tax=Granulicella pectinivorans TaxID=474950 RepID=UPI002481F5DE|nr:flippase [Granulicella pectinivorans]
MWLYAMMGLNYVIPAAMLPFLVRVLGVEQYGLIAFAQAIGQYFVIATDYGFNYSGTRAVAQSRDDKDEVSRIFWTLTTVKLVLLFFGAFVMGGMIAFIPRMRANMGIYIVTYLGVIGSAVFPTWLFQGVERMRSISIISGLAKLSSAAMILLFVRNHDDSLLAAFLLSCGLLLAGVIGMIVALIQHVNWFTLPTRGDIYGALRDGRHLFLTTAAVSLYSNTNVFLVGVLGGDAQAGYFSLADKLIRAITGLVAPIIQASYPRVIRLVSESKDLALLFIRKLMFWFMAVGLVGGSLLFLLARPIALFSFGHNAIAVVPLLRCLSLFPGLAAMTYMLSTLVLIPFGFEKVQSRLLLSVGVLNVGVGFLLIPHYGALGGVLAMTAVEAVQMVGGTWLLSRGGISIARLLAMSVSRIDLATR